MKSSDLNDIFTVVPDVDSITWIGKQHRGRQNSNNKSYLYVSASQTKAGLKRTCITFYHEIIKDLRIISGDQIMVGEDKQKNLVIKRVKKDGYKLGTNSKNEDVIKLCAQVQYLGNAPKYYQKSEVIITDDGMIFFKKEEAA
jgi:hypothetical protein